MEQQDLSRYLKYGTAKKFIYSNPVPVIDINWEEAKEQFRTKLKNSIDKWNCNEIAFCGTMSACNMVHLMKNRQFTTISVDIGIDTKKTSDLLGCKNISIPIKDLESSIIQMQKLNNFPRSSIEDIYGFTRVNYWSRNTEYGLCEGGTDYLLSNHHCLMDLAVSRGEYSVTDALKIIGSSKKIKHQKYNTYNTYTDCFNNSIVIFTDEELTDLGYTCNDIEIKDTLEDFLKAWFDWGYETVYIQRTIPLITHFGFNSFSPFVNDEELVNFCLSLPLEMKYCLGRGKHIYKEAVPIPKDVKNSMTNRIYPHIYDIIKSDVKKLVEKYLKDESRVIFSHLPYNKVQKYLGNYIKEWNLLNLAIWLEGEQ